MKVNDEPKKWTDANGAMNVITLIPKNKNMTKSAVLPRNSPSSSKRQYLTMFRKTDTWLLTATLVPERISGRN
eukprot:CAMPEP_0178979554 /NCGR_PEP_ID=MMETSP0789-20121207/25909_1 /TAXON_ID=3005 /ORGANISM="Rhizosolenia setigera, Strain CCMP 1694" /LENGTH=72 /DNA_ID=CAMNT_0020669677 /DNA_START=438 /DNA_END=656 /DNA_ORIENTATION=-